MKRSMYAGRVREKHIGQEIILKGWVARRRDAAKTLITLGESEVESGQVTVKNNQTREEVQVSLDAISQNFSKIFANIVLRYRII